MATLYVDFTNGNDSNNGTTFANRVKTITSGITAARTAPGDIIRIMKSENPVSLGVNATFTNKSDTVTLASALTANIDRCETAWTASANVTTTTSATRREGTNSVSIDVASAFTTGVIAYKALGVATNFSSYTKVSLWIQTSNAVAANTLRVDLCSDAAGTTPVNSLTITRALNQGSVWYCLTLDNGAPLGSSIQSVALRALLDPGLTTFLVDNILACNALTLSSVISLSSSSTAKDFYPIKSINGTTIKLDGGQNANANTTERGYYGTTTTATCYKIEPISISTSQATNEAGTATLRSTYSGGWDTTNMSTQTGLTFIDWGTTSNGNVDNIINLAQQYLDAENIVGIRGGNAIGMQGTPYPSTNTITNCAAIGTYYGFFNYSFGSTLNSCAGYANFYHYYTQNPGLTIWNNCAFYSSYYYGYFTQGHRLIANNTSCFNSAQGGFFSGSGAGQIKLYSCTASDNLVGFYSFSSTATMQLVNCTTSGNTTAIQSSGGLIIMNNCTLNELAAARFSVNNMGRLQVSNLNGSASTAFIYENGTTDYAAQLVTTPVRGTTTYSWRHFPFAIPHQASNPFIQELSPIAVASSGTFTFSIWVQRSSTNVGARVLLRGGQCSGIANDVSASASAAINTWEQLTITATPTQAVPIVIELQSWQISGSGNIYWGDASVSQA